MNGNNAVAMPTHRGTDLLETADPRRVEYKEWDEPPNASLVGEDVSATWLNDDNVNELESRWNSIQSRFVDEPRGSVEEADALVAQALDLIEQAFSTKRMVLDEKWINKEDIQTEDLRLAMQRYHAFLNRLLTL